MKHQTLEWDPRPRLVTIVVVVVVVVVAVVVTVTITQANPRLVSSLTGTRVRKTAVHVSLANGNNREAVWV